jgi:hypothetical protein
MSIFHKSDSTHRAILWIDNRFQIEIRRLAPTPGTATLVLYVYPITDGEVWDAPYDVFSVDEASVIELETQAKEE